MTLAQKPLPKALTSTLRQGKTAQHRLDHAVAEVARLMQEINGGDWGTFIDHDTGQACVFQHVGRAS